MSISGSHRIGKSRERKDVGGTYRKTIKLGALVALLLLLTMGYLSLAAADGSPDYDFTIQTTGTPGVKLTGTCTVDTSTGSHLMGFSDVVGRVENVKGTGFNCLLHKPDPDGEVKLTISQNGNVLSETQSTGCTTDISASVS